MPPQKQKDERASPYKYRMYHNKTVAEATLRSYTNPLLTFLPEATWREDVQRELDTAVVPMPIVVAHFAKDAPELAPLREAAMTLRGKFRFFVAPPVAGAHIEAQCIAQCAARAQPRAVRHVWRLVALTLLC